MKFIYFKQKRILEYPIGLNMYDAISYIGEITPHLKKIIQEEPLNIWCMGSSGAILAALLVKNISNSCKICHVKKRGEQSHEIGFYNRHVAGKNIILDDFSRSCKTLEKIYEGYDSYVKTPLDALVLSNGYDDTIPSFTPKCIIIDKDTGFKWKKLFKQKLI